MSGRSEIYPHDVKGYDVHEDGPKSVALSEKELGEYNELIGSLGYAVFTRFEIQAELGYLRTRLKNATRGDWDRGLRMLKYLRDTAQSAIRFAGKSSNETPEEMVKRTTLWCTSDASWNAHADGKGQSGYTISYGVFQPPFITYSGKQKTVATSSAEAEYQVYGKLMIEVEWLRHVLKFLEVEVSEVIVETDSVSAIRLASMSFVGKGVRHLSTKYHYFKDAVMNKKVRMKYRKTSELWADVLTKPVTGDTFKRLCGQIRNGLLPEDRPADTILPMFEEKEQHLMGD